MSDERPLIEVVDVMWGSFTAWLVDGIWVACYDDEGWTIWDGKHWVKP